MEHSSSATNPTRIKVRVAQRFTLVEAGALQRLSQRVPHGSTIDVDFHEVRLCQDAALLVLARAILAGAVHYALHGLSHHQTTMLAYLGADVRQAPEIETN